jgi:hypothetical protein
VIAVGYRGPLSRIVGRALIGLGVLVVLTLVVRLLLAFLRPLLPSWVFSLVGLGGSELYQMVAPALPAAAALLLIGVGWWLLSGRR